MNRKGKTPAPRANAGRGETTNPPVSKHEDYRHEKDTPTEPAIQLPASRCMGDAPAFQDQPQSSPQVGASYWDAAGRRNRLGRIEPAWPSGVPVMVTSIDNWIANVVAHRIFDFAGGPDRELINYLHHHGVDLDHCTNVAGPITRLPVVFDDGLFAYDPFGEAAAVTGVHDENAERLIDLVAWSLKDPMVFAPFLDHAGLLGSDAILNPASFHEGPCPIWSTPLRWLQAGCGGAVVLNAELACSIFSMVGIGPQDELEGMLAAQMVACHHAAMECFRRAMIPSQPHEGRQQNLNFGNKLSRTYAIHMETLDKHRGKGQQKVTVEHVHVHQGGQAIVGNVETGVGGTAKSEEQAHGKSITHAPEPEMRRPFEANPETLPQRSDEER